ncbi:carbohydrate esterase, partial [Streptomyces sp. 2MCAF27]
TALTKRLVEQLGPEGSKALYLYNEARDNTHTSVHGATEFARLVLGELRAQRLVPTGVIR